MHDIAPVRVSCRNALLSFCSADRRCGYPVELLDRAARARRTVVERDVVYGPRIGGVSKVSGSARGSVVAPVDFWQRCR